MPAAAVAPRTLAGLEPMGAALSLQMSPQWAGKILRIGNKNCNLYLVFGRFPAELGPVMAFSAVHWQLGILMFPVFGRFSAKLGPDGARPAVPVAPKISPADQF